MRPANLVLVVVSYNNGLINNNYGSNSDILNSIFRPCNCRKQSISLILKSLIIFHIPHLYFYISLFQVDQSCLTRLDQKVWGTSSFQCQYPLFLDCRVGDENLPPRCCSYDCQELKYNLYKTILNPLTNCIGTMLVKLNRTNHRQLIGMIIYTERMDLSVNESMMVKYE